jgi:uroporphyrinogen-III synthase
MSGSTKLIKNILVTQPRPTEENSPYFALATKWGVKIDFRKFIDVQRLSLNDFRKQNINPLRYTGVIFTSKMAVDYFFSLLQEMRVEVSPETKYFCVGETTSKYLQKYIVIRKRKLFVGDKTAMDLMPFLKKHKKEQFVFPCSISPGKRQELTEAMREQGIDVTEMGIYETVPCALTDLDPRQYDLLCFFSPLGIEALFKNFPEFSQGDTRIAVFGPSTAREAQQAGLTITIEAPKPNIPSLSAAIEHYLNDQKTK